MKTKLLIFAIAFQILSVAFIAIEREHILYSGDNITFQAAPVDPRDIFRGDYVILRYEFNKMNYDEVDKNIFVKGLRKGQKIYATYNLNDKGIAYINKISLDKPNEKYMQGYVKSHWPYRGYSPELASDKISGLENLTNYPLHLKFGVEQYYVQQGSGKEIEKTQGVLNRDDFALPMFINLAVSDSGKAAVKDYNWGKISIKTETEFVRNEENRDNSYLKLTLTLKNNTNNPITFPFKDNLCSFTIIEADRSIYKNKHINGIHTSENKPNMEYSHKCSTADIREITLSPNETTSHLFDFSNKDLFINHKNQIKSLQQSRISKRLRIVYTEKINELEEIISSRAFNASGFVD